MLDAKREVIFDVLQGRDIEFLTAYGIHTRTVR
jgi:hypothetical protein